MVTNFGKFCRKLRIDNNELLYNMAEKLEVSTAFLSKVENGRKKPPVEWKSRLTELYSIDAARLEELEQSFFEARNSESIDISHMEESDKNLMLSFARKLDTLDKERIRKMLER